MSADGVTSKAGFIARVPSGATGRSLNDTTSSAPRSSISISAPVGVARSIVDSGATTTNGTPACCAPRARLNVPILFAVSPFAAMRSAPVTTTSASDRARRNGPAESTITSWGAPIRCSSHAVRRVPWSNGRVSSTSACSSRPASCSVWITASAVPRSTVASAARVADRHRANRAVADKLLYELGTPPTHLPGRCDLLVADRNRLGKHRVEAILRPLRDSVDHAGEVDRSRARGAQRAHGLTECFRLPVDAICERDAERTGDSKRRSAAHRKTLDRFDERRHIGDAERHDFRGKPGLVDQLDRVARPVNGPHDWKRIGAVDDSRSALEECVHYSRLIGADPALVLHGGGNSSIKTTWRDITGRDIDALFVKGSGWEMATIDAAGFAPLALGRLHELLELESLSDAEMMRELAAAKLDPDAPTPSVETLLHAFLPFPAVQHSHADVIAALTNLANGEEVVREVFGGAVVVVPYVMPGFDLAREVRRIWPGQADGKTRGMVLLNHGLFTFGATSREAYEQHLELLETAEAWLNERAPALEREPPPLREVSPSDLAELRRTVSRTAGRPLDPATSYRSPSCVGSSHDPTWRRSRREDHSRRTM